MNRAVSLLIAGGVFWTGILVVALLPILVTNPLHRQFGIARSVSAYTAITLAVIIGFYLAALSVRFAFRAVPERTERPRRRWWLLGVGALLLTIALFDLRSSFAKYGPKAVALGHVSGALGLFFFPGIAFVAFAQLGNRASGRKVVFLRRFGSFADRSMLSAVVDALPSDHSVVMLVSPNERVPAVAAFSAAFAGFRALAPLSRMAFYYAAPNEIWLEFVEKHVTDAGCVVMDMTEESESIRDELRVVNLRARDNLVALVDARAGVPTFASGVTQSPITKVVPYERVIGLFGDRVTSRTRADLKRAVTEVLEEYAHLRRATYAGTLAALSGLVLFVGMRWYDEREATRNFDCRSVNRFLDALVDEMETDQRVMDRGDLSAVMTVSRRARDETFEASKNTAPESLPWSYGDRLPAIQAMAMEHKLAFFDAFPECASESTGTVCVDARQRGKLALESARKLVTEAKTAMPACCRTARSCRKER